MSLLIEDRSGLDPTAEDLDLRIELSLARESLCEFLSVKASASTVEVFETSVVRYLNSFTDFYFGTSDEVRYRALNNGPKVVKTEVELLLRGRAIEPLADIAVRLADYTQDEHATLLLEESLNPLPRAMVLTMMDLVEQNRP